MDRLSVLRSRRPRRRLIRYLIGIAVVAATTVLREVLDPLLGDQLPYLLYVAAVVVATWFAGGEAGVLSALAGAVVCNYLFVPPRYEFIPTAQDYAAVITFLAVTFGLVWLVGRWKRTESAARQRAEELQAILDTVPAAVFITRDAEARQMSGNRFTADVLRLPAGGNMSKTAPADERPTTFRAMKDGKEIPGEELPVQAAMSRGAEIRDYEFDLVYEDGSSRTLLGNASPLVDEAGVVCGSVGAFVDITERKQVEYALRATEGRFRTVLQNSQDGINLLDLTTGRYVFMSPSQIALTGFTVEELNDLTAEEAHERVHPDDRHLAIEQQQRIAQGIDPGGTPIEYRWKMKSGEYRWFSDSRKLVRDEEGRPIALVGVSRDITEQKRAEAALKQSEARFRSVLEGSRDVIYRVDIGTGRYEYISPSCAGLVGFGADELMAIDADASLAMVHPDDLPVMRAAVARVLHSDTVRVEYRQRTKSGEYRWMSNNMSAVRDADGRAVYRDGNIRDVTDQKQMEDALHRTVSQLEHANLVKDEFLATLSHELRTPLNAILGWSEMLARGGLAADIQQKALDSIRRNAQAQAALINDILDVSRIISGKLRLDLRPVDLRDLVRAACESMMPAAHAKGVDVRTRVEGNPVLVGDPDRLQQVVWNLVANSVKFTDRGGRVDVDVRQVGSRVEIAVRDDGAGISPGFLPHVFERFRQADASTTRQYTGLGLGLALVRSLTELHGGTVSAASEGEGKGATFTVVLPVPAVLQAPADEHPRAPEPTGGAAAAGGRLEGLHVLVVDDQEEARVLVKTVLEQRVARVTTCATADQAIASVMRDRPDVLVADIGMPGCDGYELMRRIRALPDPRAKSLPAVAVTAYTGTRDREQALAAGFREHLPKPVLPQALIDVVAAVGGRP